MGLWSNLNNKLFNEKKEERLYDGNLSSKYISATQEFHEYLKDKPYLNSDDEANFRIMKDLIRVFCFHKSENLLDDFDYGLVHRLWFLMYHYIVAHPSTYFDNLSDSDKSYLLQLLDDVTKTRIRLFGIKNKKDGENPFDSLIKIAKEAGKEND